MNKLGDFQAAPMGLEIGGILDVTNMPSLRDFWVYLVLMSYVISYIKAQDKIKLVLYIASFLFYVGINNLIFNTIVLFGAGIFYFNDVQYFSFPCSAIDAETILFFGNFFKVLLFILLLISHKKNFKYITEILILYFLFDIGQVGSLLIGDIVNNYSTQIKLDGLWYFGSNFERLWTYFDYSIYPICIFWSIVLGIFLWKTKRFSIDYFAKRFFIMPISGLTYGIIKYFYLYHFVWHT